MPNPPPLARRSPRRRRPAPRRRIGLGSLPVSIRYGVPAAAIAFAAIAAYQSWRDSFAYLQIVDAAGQPISQGSLELLEWDSSGSALAPSRPLAAVEFDDPGPVALGSDLFGAEALARIRAPGCGVGFALVRRGAGVQQCGLGPPRSTAGRVLGPDDQPIAGAAVQGFGGGPHGVLLAEAVTGSDGAFVLDGISATVPTLHVRVLQPGHAVLDQDWWMEGEQERDLHLVRTRSVEGWLRAADLPLGGHRVQAFGLPGVYAITDDDGRFRLDHLPPAPTRTPLVVATLPAGTTHDRITVTGGDEEVAIAVYRAAVVSGQVIDGPTGVALAGAWVRHEYGPSGIELARCDAGGRFRIGSLPPGAVVLSAVLQVARIDDKGRERPALRQASVPLTIEEGEHRSGVGISLYN